jgi:crotonobetaine/carnitine-CoA ligase
MMPSYSFTNLPLTLHALLDLRAAELQDQIYVNLKGRSLSYGQLASYSLDLAARLKQVGVMTGDRVMLLMPASEYHLSLWFALSRISAVEVPVNPAYKGALLRQLIETAAPSLCIIDDEYLEEFVHASAGLIATERIVRPRDLPLSDAPAAATLGLEPKRRDTSCIIFTSGTTGRSKGVMMSHAHQLAFGAAFAEIVGLTEADTTYNFLPFFHIAAKFVALGTMLAGGKMLLRPGFSVSCFWDDVRQNQVTVCAAVGGLCHMLNSVPPTDNDAENPLKVLYAVPVPWEFKAEFEARFGIRFIEGYGGTESNLVAYSRLAEETPRSSLGRPSPYFDLQIQDEDGNELTAGQPGEICIRPRFPGTMMTGYFGVPEKTLEAMTDFWFHTGDRGYADANGFLYFQDRLHDAIRRRGENISSFEVERILNALGDVAESAVIPVPSALGEDEVKAIVVLKRPGALNEEAIFRYAMESMPYFMVPRYIEFRAELPRTPTMKVKKAELRAEGNSATTWDCERNGLRISRRGLVDQAAHTKTNR